MEKPQETPVLFPETRQLQPCSFNKCAAGHSWRPTLLIVQCPGCTGPVLARKMENCPICNEPVVHTTLRTDHVPPKSGVPRLCCGEPSRGESTAIELDCEHFKAVELTAEAK